MGKANQPLLAFNRGIISPLGLARVDVAKVLLSAEEQVNWYPRLLGSMMLRPGSQYLGPTRNNSKALYFPFIYSKTERALIEFTGDNIRFWENDQVLSRPAVTATIVNGAFNGNLNGWVDSDDVGATSSWASGNYMQLLGDGVNFAKRYQLVTCNQIGTKHAVRVVINRGPVKFRIGSSITNDDYFEESTLGTGTHSLAFTPQGDFYITFYSNLDRITLVQSIAIESAGNVVLPSPYSEDELSLIRGDQSLDVIYLCGASKQQRKLERRGDGDSWSIVLYQPEDGPVGTENTTTTTLAAAAINGNTTLASNVPFFKTTHVGAIFKLVSVGQNVSASISGANVFTNTIKVEGNGTTRSFSAIVSGTFTATITYQRSFDDGTSWFDVGILGVGTTAINDGLDGQVVLYRAGIKTGDYTSGTANVSLQYSLGSITGYVRVTSFNNSQSVNIEVLKDLGSTTATTQWSEGEWSDAKGWPSGVALSEGRLCFGGDGNLICSISDAYESFDDEVSGDSGLISRELGSGAISSVTWLISLYRLFAGCDTSVKSVKTSSFEEPMTPTNLRIVEPSTQSCYPVPPAKLDKKAIFIQGAGTRVFQLTYDASQIDYIADELTKACPEIGQPSLLRIGVQRQPDTIIHFVRSDGKVVLLIFDELENLKAFYLYETAGEVEDVIILPGDIEDYVYYSIKRTVNGNTVRYLEKFAFQLDCQGGILNKQADSFIEYSGTPTSTITGLNHLEGEEVIVWADGKDLSPGHSDQRTYTVISGTITLDEEVSSAIIGLPYKARYRSAKLAYASSSPLGQYKKVNKIGVIIHNTHSRGLRYGRDFNDMDTLPEINPVTGKKTPYNTIFNSLDTPQVSFNGNWDTDSRLCLEAQAPRPCTLLACEIAITTNDRS